MTGTCPTKPPSIAARGRELLGRWSRIGLGLLFPPRCVHCEAETEAPGDGIRFCDECRAALAPDDWLCCLRCGGIASSAYTDRSCCEWCRGVPLEFDTVVSLGPYHGELKKAVLQMKHPRGEVLSQMMGRLLCAARGAALAGLKADWVTAVPMHWRRRLGRSTNSAETLAAPIARMLRRPYRPRWLVRSRATLPQKDMPPSRRFENVRGAFRMAYGARLDGDRVLVVDDILTTGATSSEIAKVLKAAGAGSVVAAVLARAEGDQFG